MFPHLFPEADGKRRTSGLQSGSWHRRSCRAW